MKKIPVFMVFIVAFGMMALASADTISFVQPLQGVDGNTSGWSNNNTTVNLGVNNWGLLGSAASVNSFGGNLTHRGTRGLGVFGHEDDEIDSYGNPESIEITFNKPYRLNNLEVRSLFFEPNLWNNGVEEGQVDFYLLGNQVGGQHLVGWEDIRTQGTNGVNSFIYNNPTVIDKLVFYVPTNQTYTHGSEFAVAKLGVTAVPEPISTILFLTGGTVLVVRRLRRRK